MRGKTTITVMIVIIVALCAGLIGCKGPKGPQGPQGPPGTLLAHITGAVETPTSWNSDGYAEVVVLWTHDVPAVWINDIHLSFNPTMVGPRIFRHYDFPISAGDSAKLVTTFTKLNGDPGTARADIIMPGQFEITYPDTSYPHILGVGASLAATWSSSDEAEAYWAYLILYYNYTDTLGHSDLFYYESDTLLTDTAITFSSLTLFPNAGEIAQISSGWGSFRVWAVAGPAQAGAELNVTGDGVGAFYGLTFGGDVGITVSGSKSPAEQSKEPKNFLREFLDQRAKNLNIY
jgi:hypothetical protein